MHGIEVTRKPAGGSGVSMARRGRVRRISVCYGDGGMLTFIPEAGEELFSKDDIDRLVGLLDLSSASLEWRQMVGGIPDAEQGGGLI